MYNSRSGGVRGISRFPEASFCIRNPVKSGFAFRTDCSNSASCFDLQPLLLGLDAAPSPGTGPFVFFCRFLLQNSTLHGAVSLVLDSKGVGVCLLGWDLLLSNRRNVRQGNFEIAPFINGFGN